MRKSKDAVKRPSPKLFEIVEATNLVPFDAELMESSLVISESKADPCQAADLILESIKDFPLLIEHLKKKSQESVDSYPESENPEKEKELAGSFVTKFNEYERHRKFLKILVKFAAEYRDYLHIIDAERRKTAVEREQIGAMINQRNDETLSKFWRELNSHTNGVFANCRLPKLSCLHRGASNWWTAKINPNAKDDGEVFIENGIDYMELITDENHTSTIQVKGLVNLIEGYDLRRFKQCTVCQKIIWADRLDAKFCSRKCSNKGWQRIYQSDDLKRREYNEKRRATYRSKVEQKKARSKK